MTRSTAIPGKTTCESGVSGSSADCPLGNRPHERVIALAFLLPHIGCDNARQSLSGLDLRGADGAFKP